MEGGEGVGVAVWAAQARRSADAACLLSSVSPRPAEPAPPRARLPGAPLNQMHHTLQPELHRGSCWL